MITDYNAYQTKVKSHLESNISDREHNVYTEVTQLIAVFIRRWLCKRVRLLFLRDIWDGVNQLDMHSTEMEESWIFANTNFTAGDQKTQYSRNKDKTWEHVSFMSEKKQFFWPCMKILYFLSIASGKVHDMMTSMRVCDCLAYTAQL